MANKMQDQAKTLEPPKEMTIDELDKLTRPGTADEAFKAGASANGGAMAQSVTVTAEQQAFALQGGQYAKGQDVKLGEALDVDQKSIAIAKAQAREADFLTQKSEGLIGVDRVTELRMEMDAKFSHLYAAIAEFKTQHSGPKIEGDVMLAKMRGTIYCPECEVQLEGGSATAMANMPYTHPMGSAAPKPCSMTGLRFEKPSVYIKRLPAAPYRKPIPA